MKRLSLALACILALTLPAAAQSTRDERLVIAREYMNATLADLDTERLLQSMYNPLLGQIEASGQRITDAQRTQVAELYRQEILPQMMDIMSSQDEVMADLFTLEEITALRDFYATPLGRSVMSKLPAIIEIQQPQIMAMVQGTLPRLMPRLQSIFQN
ncbi:MAG: DUF2059 domain-containing protein [Paracoccaceae bacterium]